MLNPQTKVFSCPVPALEGAMNMWFMKHDAWPVSMVMSAVPTDPVLHSPQVTLVLTYVDRAAWEEQQARVFSASQDVRKAERLGQ